MKQTVENEALLVSSPAVAQAATGRGKAKERLLSLDALRGFDMFWIISGEGIFHGIAAVIQQKHGLQQSPVDWQIATTNELTVVERFFVGVSNQLHHTVWNGFTFYDLIFPLFIFIAGVSMPYSFNRYFTESDQAKQRSTKRAIYVSLAKRTAILLFLGMVVNGLLEWKEYENTRFASVLGRIALSCFFAAIIYLNASFRKQLFWFAALLLGYWALMVLVPVPGFGAGVLTPEGNLEAWVDRLALPGKLHRRVYDPEGLLSTVPAIGSALLGIFTGQFIRYHRAGLTPTKKALALFVAGAVLLLAGWLWGQVFPINKNMWTSSFVLYAGGWSVWLFALFYAVIDVGGYQRWSSPLGWIGKNSILIYLLAHGVLNFLSTSEFVFGGLVKQVPAVWHPALLWTGVALIQLALLFFFNRKKWFLKV